MRARVSLCVCVYVCVCLCLRALLTLFEFCNNFFPFSVCSYAARNFVFCALSFARSLALTHSGLNGPQEASTREEGGEEGGEERGETGVAIDNKQA